jgi:AcrR family transcriptional regulator
VAGLRERKKQRTREAIAETAWTLIADRGFAEVTVADIARAAEVSEATVFNYFRTKEDLFFARLDAYGLAVVAAIAERPVGEGVAAAYRRILTAPGGLLAQVDAGNPHALERLRTVNRVIAASPRLQARETRSFAMTADALADVLAREAANGAAARIEAEVVAHALVAVQRALVHGIRRIVLGGEAGVDLVARLGADADAAFALLSQGIGDYGRRTNPNVG